MGLTKSQQKQIEEAIQEVIDHAPNGHGFVTIQVKDRKPRFVYVTKAETLCSPWDDTSEIMGSRFK